ncbi:MAG TPA: hypothetical protein VF275_06730 [Gammaproteobacteria bacterium]
MKALKYFGIVVLGFFIFGSGSSAWLIVQGLMNDQVNDEGYFIKKLILYVVIALASAAALTWLAISLKKKQDTSSSEK